MWAVYRSRLQKREKERTGQLREVAEVLDATVSGEDGSGDDLLDHFGRLRTMMKCFQREVKSTDEKVLNAKKLSSMLRSPRRKKRRRKKLLMCSFLCGASLRIANGAKQ